MAAELRRLAGAPPAQAPETVALVPGLSQLATVPGAGSPADLVAIDAAGCTAALLLIGGPAGYELGRVALPQATVHVDLTRSMAVLSSADAAPLPDQQRPLTPESVVRWTSFAIALTCADLVGTCGAPSQLGCDYAASAVSRGAIGSFQAVQHLLADAFVAMEGSRSVALHAAWAVDALPAGEALGRGGRQGLLRPGRPRRVRDGHPGARRHRQHLGVPGPRIPAAGAAVDRLLGGVGPSLERVLAHHGIGGVDGLR